MAYRKEARGISRTAEAPRWPRCRQAFKLGLGDAKSPRRDPPLRHSSPEWGSTNVNGDLVKETEKLKQNVAPKEDQPTLPQAVTPTPTSDVRILDKQSDLEMTPTPAANKHYRG